MVAGFQEPHGPLRVGTKSDLLFLERGMPLNLKVWGTRLFFTHRRWVEVETGSSTCQGAVNYWETKESNPILMVHSHPILLCCEAQLGEINAPRVEPKHEKSVFCLLLLLLFFLIKTFTQGA